MRVAGRGGGNGVDRTDQGGRSVSSQSRRGVHRSRLTGVLQAAAARPATPTSTSEHSTTRRPRTGAQPPQFVVPAHAPTSDRFACTMGQRQRKVRPDRGRPS